MPKNFLGTGVNILENQICEPMSGKNRQLVTDELVEIRDFRRITDHFRRIYEIYLECIKQTGRCQHVTGWI